jgi:cob(I)alamin adenosyltransferase
MAKDKSSLYTRRGDDGTTGLGGGQRVEKSSLRIEVIGTLDELNSLLGMAVALGAPAVGEALLLELQRLLLLLGAELALAQQLTIDEAKVGFLEERLDALDRVLPPLTGFILPGGTAAGAALHLARTVCRRAERSLCRLAARPEEEVNPMAVPFLNRLSDLLFVLARSVNRAGHQPEQPWHATPRETPNE